MRYMLDTTLLIDTAVGTPTARAILDRLFAYPNDLYTCDVIACEALSGGTDEERQHIARMLEVLEYVSTTPEAARWAAASRRQRAASSHRTLGDALIAAVAWSLEATIVTRNPDDFVRQGIPVLTY